ncbi:MAG TPA: hypothetical protein VNK67_03305 [Burkholderiales bacterium]|nr:hypothetical protein [Burkholderiales bacterium]
MGAPEKHGKSLPLLPLALACAVSFAAAAQEMKLEFVDEAARDASWTGFRKRLLAALEKRDLKFVLSILDRNVRAGHEGARGGAEFRRLWSLDAADSPLWRELTAALMLGSAWLRREDGSRELCAPYVLARWPQDVDPMKHGVLVAREVLVKSEPSQDSPTLAALSYAIVPVADWEVDDRAREARQKWVRIRLKEAEGYVPEEQIRSPVEHAACFVRTEGGWRMTAFAPAGG